ASLKRLAETSDQPIRAHSTAQADGVADSVPRMFGSTLAEIFSASDYDCRLQASHEKPDFAVTRLRSGPRPAAKASLPATHIYRHALLCSCDPFTSISSRQRSWSLQ